jgi:hypothetical protein
VGPVTVGTGTISPGGSPGILHTSSITTSSGTVFNMEINGDAAGTEYDQIITAGSIALDGTLVVALDFAGIAPLDEFFIWLNDGTDPIGGAGMFSGLPEGGSIPAGSGSFTISYLANGDLGAIGNDISLTYVPEPGSAALAAAAGAMVLGRRRRRMA